MQRPSGDERAGDPGVPARAGRDPRDLHGAGSKRKAVAAVGALAGAVLVISAVATYSALHAPVPASAADSPAATRALAAGAKAVQAGLEAAAKYQRDGKYAEAGTILTKLAEAEPTDREVRVAYAQALMGQKRHEDAFKQYEAAVALLPAGTTQRIAAGGDKDAAELYFEAATCANMAGRVDRAIEFYSMAQTADRVEPKYPLYLAMVQLKTGKKEDEEAAVAGLLRAAKLNPELAEAWGTLAEIETRREQLGLAAQHIAEARRLQPGVARWRVDEARILNRRGEAEKAAALLTALPSEQRNQAAVLSVLGESFGLMKKPDEAARVYEEAFKAVSPPDAELAYQASLWLERAGEKARAAEMARVAAALGRGER